MSGPTAIPAVEDAVLAAVRARASAPGSALAGVAIDPSEPLELQTEHVWIALADVASSFEPESTGYDAVGSWVETVTVPVRAHVQAEGDDWTALRDRAKALVAEVILAVRADPTLGAAVLDAQVVRLSRRGAAMERAIALLTTVEVSARVEVS